MLIWLFDVPTKPIYRCRSITNLAVAVSIATVLTVANLFAADRAESTGNWEVTADSPTEAVDWPARLTVSIPVPQKRDELLFPTSQSNFCLTGLKLNLETKKKKTAK